MGEAVIHRVGFARDVSKSPAISRAASACAQGDGWEVVEEPFQAIARGKIVDQIPERTRVPANTAVPPRISGSHRTTDSRVSIGLDSFKAMVLRRTVPKQAFAAGEDL